MLDRRILFRTTSCRAHWSANSSSRWVFAEIPQTLRGAWAAFGNSCAVQSWGTAQHAHSPRSIISTGVLPMSGYEMPVRDPVPLVSPSHSREKFEVDKRLPAEGCA